MDVCSSSEDEGRETGGLGRNPPPIWKIELRFDETVEAGGSTEKKIPLRRRIAPPPAALGLSFAGSEVTLSVRCWILWNRPLSSANSVRGRFNLGGTGTRKRCVAVVTKTV